MNYYLYLYTSFEEMLYQKFHRPEEYLKRLQFIADLESYNAYSE